jgi:hypothetical protein
LATSNKDFKIKNGLIVEGATATVDGSDILTTAASVGDLADVSISSPENSQVLSYEASTDLWKNITISGSSGIIVSPTPPTEPTPTEGTQWFNSSNGTTYIYYDSFWIPTSPPKTGPQGPAGDDGATGPEGPQGPAGAVAADALGNFTGAWENGVDYDPGDVVELNGSSYYAPTGIFSSYSPPNNGWLLVASKGDTGEAGEDGATGSAGADGEDGATGDTGPAGPGVAAGGTTGQILIKASEDDYDTVWEEIPESAAVISSTTPPENTSAIWFNTENGVTYIYYDSYWTSISGSSGAPIVSDTAPSSPVVGMQWFNSSNGKLYMYYSDAWVEIDSNGTATASTGNTVINGAFDIWQRGTSFSSVAGGTYFADRFVTQANAGAQTITRVTDAPTGFTYAARVQRSAVSFSGIAQRIESLTSSLLVDQPVVISFWAKTAEAGQTVRAQVLYPSAVDNFATTTVVETVTNTITSSWTRYTATFSPLTASFVTGLEIRLGTNSSGSATHDLYITGVQLEAGTIATPFRRNSPSIQAELAACQRYCYVKNGSTTDSAWGWGRWESNNFYGWLQHPVQMRVPPTSYVLNNPSGFQAVDPTVGWYNITGINSIHKNGSLGADLLFSVSGASVTNRTFGIMAINSGSGQQLIVSAEL